eukprot:10477395-Alexandrium_andersonii.AAC.1
MGALGACLVARLDVGALVVIVRTHAGALHVVDAQGCMPHTQASQCNAACHMLRLRSQVMYAVLVLQRSLRCP